MLARGTGILAKAIADHTAVPAFATYNLEMVQAVVAAAEQTGQPVIMLAGSSHFHHAGRTTLISIALQAAHDSTATSGVHLDHCRALAEIEPCVNINTELRQAYLAAVQSALPAVLSTHDSVALWRAGREAVTTAAVRSIHALSATSWATLSEPDLGPYPAANRAATSPDRRLRR
jgi:fructose/tagatose bisphosphate aldolase